jgi:hypothetical protein
MMPFSLLIGGGALEHGALAIRCDGDHTARSRSRRHHGRARSAASASSRSEGSAPPKASRRREKMFGRGHPARARPQRQRPDHALSALPLPSDGEGQGLRRAHSEGAGRPRGASVGLPQRQERAPLPVLWRRVFLYLARRFFAFDRALPHSRRSPSIASQRDQPLARSTVTEESAPASDCQSTTI